MSLQRTKRETNATRQAKPPYRFKFDGRTFQIDSDQTVWRLQKTQRGHEALHLMLGPDAEFILRHGRALQWTEQRNDASHLNR